MVLSPIYLCIRLEVDISDFEIYLKKKASLKIWSLKSELKELQKPQSFNARKVEERKRREH